MDLSVEYIEMCRKAVEIQELCPFQEGDFILNTSSISPPEGFLFINYRHQPDPDKPDWELLYKPDQKKAFNIWLPRQDQLQEIVWNKWYHGDMTGNFNSFNVWQKMNWIWGNSNEGQWFKTAEQLFLAFVMHEKYGKKWDGEDWS